MSLKEKAEALGALVDTLAEAYAMLGDMGQEADD